MTTLRTIRRRKLTTQTKKTMVSVKPSGGWSDWSEKSFWKSIRLSPCSICSCARFSLIQDCQLSLFSRKLPEFEAHLRVYEFLMNLPSSVHIPHFYNEVAQIKLKESTCNLCRLAHSKVVNCKKMCRVPTSIGIGTVSIIATLIIPIPWIGFCLSECISLCIA